MKQDNYEVIIIGGSYSGLAAALALGRSQRKTLVLDDGMPCNRQTPHSHNFLTQDGQTPAAISQLAKDQVLEYPSVSFRSAIATDVHTSINGFEIETANERFGAQKLIFATGIEDLFPDIDGIRACWGISVIHCPYCHGFEHRNKKAGILANGAMAMHLAPLVHNLNKDLCILSNGPADFDADQLARFRRNNVSIVESEIRAIVHENGHVRSVQFRDGSEQALETIYAALSFKQSTSLPEKLGCNTDASGYLTVNDFFETSIPGIYACGDNTAMMRSLSKSVFNGSMAGAAVNKSLAEASFS